MWILPDREGKPDWEETRTDAYSLCSPAVVEGLAQSAHGYNVTVLSRAASSYTPPAGVSQIKTDYTHDSLVSALKGQDVVVSTISMEVTTDQTKIVDAAIEAGVKRFIPSEFGSDTTNKVTQESFPPFMTKVEVLKYLQSKQDQIEWTAIFNGFFFDWCVCRIPVFVRPSEY